MNSANYHNWNEIHVFNFEGVMPYVPKVLPAVIPDPAVRRRAEEAFLSEDFKENIESYFVDNIKVMIKS